MNTSSDSDQNLQDRVRSMFGMDEAQVRAEAAEAPSLPAYVVEQVTHAKSAAEGGALEAARQAMNRAKRVLAMIGDGAGAWRAARLDGEAGTVADALETLTGLEPRDRAPGLVLSSLLSDAQELLAKTKGGPTHAASEHLSVVLNLSAALWGDLAPRQGIEIDWIATIARFGAVEIANGLSSTAVDRDARAWTIRVGCGEHSALIRSTIDDDQLPAEVGPILADTLRDHVAGGAYIHRLTPGEILGIRGRLASQMAEASWTLDPTKPWRGPVVELDPATLPTVVVRVGGGLVQSVDASSPARVVIADENTDGEDLDAIACIGGENYSIGAWHVAQPRDLAYGRQVVADTARTLADQIAAQADQVCEAYEFGDGVTLAAWGQSETHHTDRGVSVHRICYLEFDDAGGAGASAPTERATLHIEIHRPRVKGGEWLAASAHCLLVANGAEVGHWPNGASPATAPVPSSC